MVIDPGCGPGNISATLGGKPKLQIGAEALSGVVGAATWKYRLGNTLSGRRPSVPTIALSMMCVTRRRGDSSPAACAGRGSNWAYGAGEGNRTLV
ncbi:hypothetical protein [Variovorax paradoxus]|uniref:hypothetical protein n=1 Tax=Variovorax paradoxus TaxID=34073 RepID=UPI003D65038B